MYQKSLSSILAALIVGTIFVVSAHCGTAQQATNLAVSASPSPVPITEPFTTFTVTGTLTDADGAPVPDQLFIVTEQHRYYGQTVNVTGGYTKSDGSFNFDVTGSLASDGTYEWYAYNPDYPVFSGVFDHTLSATGTYWYRAIYFGTDEYAGSSAVVQVTVGSPPVAIATPSSVSVHAGAPVVLDGSASFDPSGLGLNWTWYQDWPWPEGSGAQAPAPIPVTSFTPDVPGTYTIALIVSNNQGAESAPAFVTVTATNTPPVAVIAESDQTIPDIMWTVSLDGSGSNDGDGDPLAYLWTFASQPPGSTAEIISPNAAVTAFQADQYGDYDVQLTVSDGFASSSSTCRITVQQAPPSQEGAEAQTENVRVTITILTDLFTSPSPLSQSVMTLSLSAAPQGSSSAPKSIVFKNPNMQAALVAKINAVIHNIESGDYTDAAAKLRDDVLTKTDGCAKTGAPDNNDWIIHPGAQALIYPEIVHIITQLQALPS